MKMMQCAVLLTMMLAGTGVAQEKVLLDGMVLDWLRVVDDPDGETNVRTAASTKARVASVLPSGCVVAVLPKQAKDGFDLVDDVAQDEEHYIHSSRLKKVMTWKQYGPAKPSEDGQSTVLKAPAAEVRIKAVPFVIEKHLITKDVNGAHYVDGDTVWGGDGELPVRGMDMTVTLGGKEVVVPTVALKNLYSPSMEFLYLLTPDDPAKQALLLMMNGDGAGAYCVVWAFQDGKYKGRVAFVPF